jgi:ABC-type sulfate transport system substrate-binding protein
MGFEKSKKIRDDYRESKKTDVQNKFLNPKTSGGIKKYYKKTKKYSKKNKKHKKINKKYFKNITNKKKVKKYKKTIKKYKKYRK